MVNNAQDDKGMLLYGSEYYEAYHDKAKTLWKHYLASNIPANKQADVKRAFMYEYHEMVFYATSKQKTPSEVFEYFFNIVT